MSDDDGAVLALTAAGVTLLLDASGDRLPSIVHWGPELPGIDEPVARALVTAQVTVLGSNTLDVPPRLSVLPEPWTGWSGRPGVRGSFAGAGWSPRFVVDAVRLDGSAVTGFVSAGAGLVGVHALDDSGRLELDLELELEPSGLLRARARLTNRAAEVYTVDDVVLAFPVPSSASELLDFAGRHNLERVPQRREFGVGTHLRENRKGRTGADSAYLLHAGTPGFGFADGQVHAVHTAFSGNHTHYAERTFLDERVLGGGELLLPGEVQLATGESYTSPWVYGAFGVGLDAVARRFHAHLRARPRRVSTDRPVTLNVWEAVYFDHRLDRLVALAERAAQVGVERYVLDDGWFGARRHDRAGLGDWVVSPQAWPDGLDPLIRRVKSLGMQFGLWFEPEMVNPDSDVARAHPEWIMAARPQWPIEARHQQVLNLSIPQAYAHVRDQLLAVLRAHDIDYVKWDHNRDLTEAGDQTRAGRAAVHAQTLAVYRLFDEIRSALPDLEIESCSSGGARIDLAVLERTDRVWVSDNIDPHDRQSMLRWTTQLIPPEFMGSHIASPHSHTTGRRHDLSFRAATAIFGHLGIEWDLTAASDEDLDQLSAWIAFYSLQRDLLLDGDVVRMDGVAGELMVHGVVARDRSRALVSCATLDSPYPNPPARWRFRGLDPARRYRVRPVVVGPPPSGLRPAQWWGAASGPSSAGARVTYDGVVTTGAALAEVGLAAPLLHPDQAVLYLVDAV